MSRELKSVNNGAARSPSSVNDRISDPIPPAARRLGRVSGAGRAAIVVFGGLLVLQSSQDLGPLKVGYLAVATGAVLASMLSVRRMWQSPTVASARPWLIASGVVAGLIAVSLPVAAARGTEISAWLRDAAAYGLLVAAPWLAVDMALSTSRRTVLTMAVVAGAAATVSFAVVWIQRRHMMELPIDRLALPSMVLAAALFSLALAFSISVTRHRYWWAATASLTIGLLVYSGTRSSLILLLVCPITLLASWLSDRSSPFRPRLLIALTPVVVAIGIVGATQIRLDVEGSLLGTGPTVTIGGTGATPSPSPTGRNLTERYDSLGTVLSGRDPSLQDRLSQTRAVWHVFMTSPIVGAGLGVPIPWTDSRGVMQTDNAFTADTPILFLAKFGLLGLAFVASIGWATLTTIRKLAAGGLATRQSWLSIVAFASALVLLMPFGWQFEDKGTALALVLMLGFGLVDARDRQLRDEPSGVGSVAPLLSRTPDGASSGVVVRP
jgi:hypothetical protein